MTSETLLLLLKQASISYEFSGCSAFCAPLCQFAVCQGLEGEARAAALLGMANWFQHEGFHTEAAAAYSKVLVLVLVLLLLILILILILKQNLMLVLVLVLVDASALVMSRFRALIVWISLSPSSTRWRVWPVEVR